MTPEPACLGDVITFTAGGVVDSGGIKRVFCSAKQAIEPGAIQYSWTLSIPSNYPAPIPFLGGTGPMVSVIAKVPGTYSATFTASSDRECPPLPITIGPATTTVTKITIVAERIDQDDPTNTSWSGLSNGSPVYAGSEASTSDNLRLRVTPTFGPVADVVWTVEGPGSATYTAPPSGPQATEWDLGDLLNPVPDEVTFHVQVNYVGGGRQCGEFASEIGVRTDDVIVVGWIDPGGVGLPAVASEWLLEVMPADGNVTSPFDCNLYAFRLTENHDTGNDLQVLTANDRNYTLHWMFRYAGNDDPRSSAIVPGGDFRDGTDTHIDEVEVTSFRSEPTN